LIGTSSTINTASTTSTVGVGDSCTIGGTGSIAIGNTASSTSNNAIAIGNGAIANVSDGLFYRTTLASVAGTTVEYDATTGQMGPAVSSRRFKENIEELEDRTDDLLSLRPVRYNLKGKNRSCFGFIAEEAVINIPEVVPLDKSGRPLSINYDKLVTLLVQGYKKMNERIVQLEDEIKILKRKKE
jgi:hypothetical protein